MGKEQKANGPKKKKNDAPRHADLYIHRFAAEVRIEGGIRSLEQTYKKNQLTPPERRRNNFSATPTSSECLVASFPENEEIPIPPPPPTHPRNILPKRQYRQKSRQRHRGRKSNNRPTKARALQNEVDRIRSKQKARTGTRADSAARKSRAIGITEQTTHSAGKERKKQGGKQTRHSQGRYKKTNVQYKIRQRHEAKKKLQKQQQEMAHGRSRVGNLRIGIQRTRKELELGHEILEGEQERYHWEVKTRTGRSATTTKTPRTGTITGSRRKQSAATAGPRHQGAADEPTRDAAQCIQTPAGRRKQHHLRRRRTWSNPTRTNRRLQTGKSHMASHSREIWHIGTQRWAMEKPIRREKTNLQGGHYNLRPRKIGRILQSAANELTCATMRDLEMPNEDYYIADAQYASRYRYRLWGMPEWPPPRKRCRTMENARVAHRGKLPSRQDQGISHCERGGSIDTSSQRRGEQTTPSLITRKNNGRYQRGTDRTERGTSSRRLRPDIAKNTNHDQRRAETSRWGNRMPPTIPHAVCEMQI